MALSWRSQKILSLILQSETECDNEELQRIERKSYMVNIIVY